MRPIWCVLLWAGLCFSAQAQAEPIDPHLLVLAERLAALEQDMDTLVEALNYQHAALQIFFAKFYVALKDGVITVDPESQFMKELQQFIGRFAAERFELSGDR